MHWATVNSGVLQDSVLGLLLFIIYMNDIGKVADNAKNWMVKKPDNIVGNITERSDEFARDKWAKEWLMTFNTDKCSMFNIGKNNPQNNYTLNNKVLGQSNIERDLDSGPEFAAWSGQLFSRLSCEGGRE